jgi:hypothetical protein
MQFTLGMAAKRLKLSKPTVGKYIQRGELSAVKLENGSYAIDGGELARFEANYRRQPEAEPVKATASAAGAGDTATQLAVMTERASQLEKQLAKAEAALERAEARADAAQARADAATGRVERLEAPGVAEARGLWARLVGRN